jgi:MFS family permease
MVHKDNEHGVPHYWGKTGKTVQNLITTVAITDFLLFGYDQGVMSGIISSDVFQTDFPVTNPDTQANSSTWQAFITAIYACGCFFGALFILKFGDRLGRRNAIFLGASIMILGVIIQICTIPQSIGAKNATVQFIIGRFITGMGNGINTSTVPTYQAE